MVGRPAAQRAGQVEYPSGAFVEEIRAAGFDVIYAPTARNPMHVRIVAATRTFDDAGCEWLAAAFDEVGRKRGK